MDYVYAAMWLLIGFLLIFRMGKEHKVFYLAGGFFLLLGIWRLVDIFAPQDLFAGVWGIVFRIIAVVALVLLCLVFWRSYQKDRESFKDGEKEQGAPKKEESEEKPGDHEGW